MAIIPQEYSDDVIPDIRARNKSGKRSLISSNESFTNTKYKVSLFLIFGILV